MSNSNLRTFLHGAQQYILTGVLTIIPIWVTWLVFGFLFGLLSNWGQPVAEGISKAVREVSPMMADWLMQPWFRSAIAVVWMLAALYVLGWLTTKVVGARVIAAFDSLMERIPLVQTIYGSTKKLVAALQKKPDGVHRVVLIEFPSSEMKTVGFVTRTFRDVDSGRELAAVYVPTTPNPTSGYLEIVPLDKVVSTNWSMDDAMAFIISGGAVAPDQMNYSRSHGTARGPAVPQQAEEKARATSPAPVPAGKRS